MAVEAVNIDDPCGYIQMMRSRNPYWPLPDDYGTLSDDAQKMARLATLRKQTTPIEFVAAWDLFRRLYLLTTDPGFFYHDFYPSPPFHYEAIYDCARYARNIMAAPRGFAKSIVIGTELPLFLLLTRPHYRIVLSLATDKMIEARFDSLMTQMTENEFILNDFGILKPKRGDSIWNRHHIQLTNGSVMQGFSIMGRKRGARPDMFILDDPEYDEDGDSEDSSQRLREKFETFLFRQTIPMLEKNSSIFWIGTMIGRRSFLYHACFGEDKRFDFWNRKVFQSTSPDLVNPGKNNVLWDGKWDAETLSIRKLEMGNSAFQAEFQNDPTSTEERTLKIERCKNEYLVEDFEDEGFKNQPLESSVILQAHQFNPTTKKWDLTKIPAKDFYKSLYRIITFDPARGLGLHNDYSCINVMGFDKENCLWILDMWMGRAKESVLLNNIYKMGIKWQPRVLGIESIAMQIQIVDSMKTLLEERRAGGWSPKVMPIDYTKTNKRRSKADRIATLEWRFNAGKIKYPNHLKDKWPIKELYTQTLDFTYDMALLRFDDAIDSVAMAHYVVHSRGIQNFPATRETTLADKIRAGQLNEHGVPVISGINAEDIDRETFQAIVDSRFKLGEDGQGKEIIRTRHPYRIRRNRRPLIRR